MISLHRELGPPISISRIASRVAPKEAKNANKTVVVVGTVTDDARYVDNSALLPTDIVF